MSQFFYFLCVEGNESLLKEEIKIFYPHLRFSFSRPGFVTFKNTSNTISDEQLQKFEIVFQLTCGEFFKKVDSKLALEELKKLSTQNDKEICFHVLNSVPVNKKMLELESECMSLNQGRSGQYTYDFIQTADNEVYIGKRKKDQWSSPIARAFNPHREDIISRAYFKGADSFSMFSAPKNVDILELGSVPGGITQFLLENGYRVTSVDPGQMEPSLLENKNLTFLNVAVQDYRPSKDSRKKIIISDMNLNPKMVIKEIIRLCRWHYGVKYLFVTIKLTNPRLIPELRKYKRLLLDNGFKKVHFVQLPYHRKEFLAYAAK